MSPSLGGGCNQGGSDPTFITPDGLLCRDHLHHEDEGDDWLPLARKVSRQRTARPDGGSAG
jgi:hypothetical protein